MVKNFRFADPLIHEDLFKIADTFVKKIESSEIEKFNFLLKLFDKAEIINVSDI